MKEETLTENYTDQTLSQIVKDNFRAAAVFEKYGLDFCCRGNKPIAQACEEKGIESSPIVEELNVLNTNSGVDENNYDEWDVDFLTDYIINNHHAYVRKMTPILAAHTQKVASVHGENHTEVIEIAQKFSTVYKDLKMHMMKEEEILFPYIKKLAKAKKTGSKAELPFFGSAKNPIKMMMAEHEAAGDELYEIRSLSNNYTPPADACNTFKVTYQELKDFEEDLHKHVHLENNILFPKVIVLEAELV